MPDLDSLLQGGYLKGSTTLISGAPGTAKSTLATAFALSSAQSGHRTLYVSFDETERQIALHMASVGYHVRPEVEAGNLRLAPLQAHGLPPEVHVSNILRAVDEFHAEVVIIDPISGIMQRSHSFMSRTTEYLLAQLRDRGITMPCTTLLDRTTTAAVGIAESTQSQTQSQVSTLADTWIRGLITGVSGTERKVPSEPDPDSRISARDESGPQVHQVADAGRCCAAYFFGRVIVCERQKAGDSSITSLRSES